jgi:serralysin
MSAREIPGRTRSREARGPISVIFAAWLTVSAVPGAEAFIINPSIDRWLTTSSGSRSANGDPGALTWSFAPDGTSVPDGGFSTLGPSDLIATFDTTFGAGGGGADLRLRPWFTFFEQSFARWSELSGVTYVYEAADDGVEHGSASGQSGVRGDLRIAGAVIDGSGAVLAFNYFPDNGDMVLDTAETLLFSNVSNSHRALRNTIMHEHGHGFGLSHVSTSTDNLLMEPSINTSFDGPQLDEVRAIQFYWGDANEKSNSGLGNQTASTATPVGPVAAGGTVRVGADADVSSQFIRPTATDFASITNLADTDVYAFSVSQLVELTAVLTPMGGTFTQGSVGSIPTSFNASARVDLVLEILDTDGMSSLGLSDTSIAGGIETVVGVNLNAGDYFARITGLDDTIQLYQLELSTVAAPEPGVFLVLGVCAGGWIGHRRSRGGSS